MACMRKRQRPPKPAASGPRIHWMNNDAPSKKILSREGWREAPWWVVVSNPQPTLGPAGPFPSQEGIQPSFFVALHIAQAALKRSVLTGLVLMLTIYLHFSLTVFPADGSITEQDLLEPDWKSWLTYSGDYSGRRHSALDQIHPGNVHKLAARWIFPVPGANRLVGTPIVAHERNDHQRGRIQETVARWSTQAGSLCEFPQRDRY